MHLTINKQFHNMILQNIKHQIGTNNFHLHMLLTEEVGKLDNDTAVNNRQSLSDYDAAPYVNRYLKVIPDYYFAVLKTDYKDFDTSGTNVTSVSFEGRDYYIVAQNDLNLYSYGLLYDYLYFDEQLEINYSSGQNGPINYNTVSIMLLKGVGTDIDFINEEGSDFKFGETLGHHLAQTKLQKMPIPNSGAATPPTTDEKRFKAMIKI